MDCFVRCFIGLALVLWGCNGDSSPTSGLRDVKLASQIPPFASQPNEVEIASSMKDVDPTWVLGSVVDIESGEVESFNNFLSSTAEPVVTPQTELVFKDLIENSVALNADVLGFLSGHLNDSVRAEVTIIKTSKVTMTRQDVDHTKLSARVRTISTEQREKYGIIIGYVDFVLTASLFRDVGAAAQGSGYGAKIEGKWFSKSENTAVQHRLVAITAPLRTIVEQLARAEATDVNLETATEGAWQATARTTWSSRAPVLDLNSYIEMKRKTERLQERAPRTP